MRFRELKSLSQGHKASTKMPGFKNLVSLTHKTLFSLQDHTASGAIIEYVLNVKYYYKISETNIVLYS